MGPPCRACSAEPVVARVGNWGCPFPGRAPALAVVGGVKKCVAEGAVVAALDGGFIVCCAVKGALGKAAVRVVLDEVTVGVGTACDAAAPLGGRVLVAGLGCCGRGRHCGSPIFVSVEAAVGLCLGEGVVGTDAVACAVDRGVGGFGRMEIELGCEDGLADNVPFGRPSCCCSRRVL